MGKTSRKGIGAQKNKLKVTPDLFQELKELASSYIDENYHEVPNPQPEELIVSKRPPSLQEQIQRLIKVQLSQEMGQQGAETWEEANDFDIPEEVDPISGYEINDMIDEEPIEPPPVPEPEPEPPSPATESDENVTP